MSRYPVISVEIVVGENRVRRVYGDIGTTVRLDIIRELIR